MCCLSHLTACQPWQSNDQQATGCPRPTPGQRSPAAVERQGGRSQAPLHQWHPTRTAPPRSQQCRWILSPSHCPRYSPPHVILHVHVCLWWPVTVQHYIVRTTFAMYAKVEGPLHRSCHSSSVPHLASDSMFCILISTAVLRNPNLVLG